MGQTMDQAQQPGVFNIEAKELIEAQAERINQLTQENVAQAAIIKTLKKQLEAKDKPTEG